MRKQLTQILAVLLTLAVCTQPASASTDVFVAVDDATNVGPEYAGPQLLHYSYNSTTLQYSLSGNIGLPAGTTINSLALSSSIGTGGGIYASLVGTTNEVREYSFDRSTATIAPVRSFAGTHSEIVLGSDQKLYGFDSSTGNLNHYVANGATFSVAASQPVATVGGKQHLAAHPLNGSIFAGGLNADQTMTEIAQWNSGLSDKAGYYPAGVLTPAEMTVTDYISPVTGQPILWLNNDTNISPFPSYKVWTFDTPFRSDGNATFIDATNLTHFDSVDSQSDGTLIATGYYDFSIFGGTDGTHLWAIEAGTDGQFSSSGPPITDPITCEPGSETTTGCFTTIGSPTDKFLLSVDDEDTIHVLGAGIVGGWKYDSTLNDINVVAAVHEIGTLGLPTAIATIAGPDIIAVAGDYNGDQVVDAADYTVWRDALNTSVSPGTGADGTGPGGIPDGFVDGLDYDFWKQRFGNTAGSGALANQPVPEPSAAIILLIGATGLFGLKRRKSGR
jgi:hypothetical protein